METNSAPKLNLKEMAIFFAALTYIVGLAFVTLVFPTSLNYFIQSLAIVLAITAAITYGLRNKFVVHEKDWVQQLVLKVANKHPDLWLCDQAKLEEELDDALAGFTGQLSSRRANSDVLGIPDSSHPDPKEIDAVVSNFSEGKIFFCKDASEEKPKGNQ